MRDPLIATYPPKDDHCRDARRRGAFLKNIGKVHNAGLTNCRQFVNRSLFDGVSVLTQSSDQPSYRSSLSISAFHRWFAETGQISL